MKKFISVPAFVFVLAGCVSVADNLPVGRADIAESKPQVRNDADMEMEYRTLPFRLPKGIICDMLNPFDVEPKSNSDCPKERALQEYYSKLFGVT